MINEAPICLIVLSNSCKILEINQSGVEMLEFKNKFSMIGTDFLAFIPDDQKEKFEQHLIAANKNEKAGTVLNLSTKKGNKKWMEIFSSSYQLEDNKKAIVSLIHDVDKRVKIKEELAKNKEALIETERLSALGEFASGLAHEINNPLTIIKTKTSLLSEKQKMGILSQEEITSYLEVINQTVDRTHAIVNNLRNVTRRQGNEEELELIPLKKVFQNTLTICKEKFNKAGIKIENKISDNTKALAQNVQLSQVFINLLNNSFSALASLDEKWILVESHEMDTKVRISITDSGKGIEPKIARKIMEPFYTTKQVGEGTGLGLSISSRIMNSFDGRIFYNSKKPNTQFVLEFNK
ncbi:MAG: ATP-binding protein [Vicingaceae bacterium]